MMKNGENVHKNTKLKCVKMVKMYACIPTLYKKNSELKFISLSEVSSNRATIVDLEVISTPLLHTHTQLYRMGKLTQSDI